MGNFATGIPTSNNTVLSVTPGVAGSIVVSTPASASGSPPLRFTAPCAGDGVGGDLPLVGVTSLTNVAPGETVVAGAASGTITASTLPGNNTITVAAALPNGGGEIFPGDQVTCASASSCPLNLAANPGGIFVAAANTNFTANATAGVLLQCVTTPCVLATSAAGSYGLVFTSASIPATTLLSDGVVNGSMELFLNTSLTTGTAVPIGRTINLSAAGLIGANTTLINCTVTGTTCSANPFVLSQPPTIPAVITGTYSTCPATPGVICTGANDSVPGTGVPLSFANVGSGGGSGGSSSGCPLILWSTRGGASTDPNNGSLWLYGEFAKNRLSTIPGPGQWGTSIANYALDFPATDPYNNDNTYFTDVQPGYTYFTWIQIAKNLNIAQPAAVTTAAQCSTNGNPPIITPPAPGTSPTIPTTNTLICPAFNPTSTISRAEMAYWVVRGQMDEGMVTNFLCATGGDPSGLATCPGVPGGLGVSTFGDSGAGGGNITDPFVQTGLPPGYSPVTQAMLMRYIEVMARRGYTKGQGSPCLVGTSDAVYRFCPNDPVTRGQMAVFIIRAKMSNVFPTSLSGGILVAPGYGDNFSIMQQNTPFFTDEPTTDQFYIYVQKMRELRITNGTSGTTYGPSLNITRDQVATFIVRAFFL